MCTIEVKVDRSSDNTGSTLICSYEWARDKQSSNLSIEVVVP